MYTGTLEMCDVQNFHVILYDDTETICTYVSCCNTHNNTRMLSETNVHLSS